MKIATRAHHGVEDLDEVDAVDEVALSFFFESGKEKMNLILFIQTSLLVDEEFEANVAFSKDDLGTVGTHGVEAVVFLNAAEGDVILFSNFNAFPRGRSLWGCRGFGRLRGSYFRRSG